ncbi:MAG: cytidine deaminase [Flavobacteriales bacterium]|nr:cytidine deaminase [Flavobacteriales bacterium]
MSKVKSIQISYIEYDSTKELKSIHKTLLANAKEMAEQAYAPYSNFPVGAAVLLDNGKEVGGSNQENRAFPSGLCAERVALFSAGANFPKQKILAIAIYANTEEQISPCGSCRQVMLEYEEKQGKDIEVLLMNSKGEVRYFDKSSHLLPLGFKFDNFQSK